MSICTCQGNNILVIKRGYVITLKLAAYIRSLSILNSSEREIACPKCVWAKNQLTICYIKAQFMDMLHVLWCERDLSFFFKQSDEPSLWDVFQYFTTTCAHSSLSPISINQPIYHKDNYLGGERERPLTVNSLPTRENKEQRFVHTGTNQTPHFSHRALIFSRPKIKCWNKKRESCKLIAPACGN